MQIKFLESFDKDFLIEKIGYYKGYKMQGGIGVYTKKVDTTYHPTASLYYVTLVKYEEDTTKKSWKDWFKKLRG